MAFGILNPGAKKGILLQNSIVLFILSALENNHFLYDLLTPLRQHESKQKQPLHASYVLKTVMIFQVCEPS